MFCLPPQRISKTQAVPPLLPQKVAPLNNIINHLRGLQKWGNSFGRRVVFKDFLVISLPNSEIDVTPNPPTSPDSSTSSGRTFVPPPRRCASPTMDAPGSQQSRARQCSTKQDLPRSTARQGHGTRSRAVCLPSRAANESAAFLGVRQAQTEHHYVPDFACDLRCRG